MVFHLDCAICYPTHSWVEIWNCYNCNHYCRCPKIFIILKTLTKDNFLQRHSTVHFIIRSMNALWFSLYKNIVNNHNHFEFFDIFHEQYLHTYKVIFSCLANVVALPSCFTPSFCHFIIYLLSHIFQRQTNQHKITEDLLTWQNNVNILNTEISEFFSFQQQSLQKY